MIYYHLHKLIINCLYAQFYYGDINQVRQLVQDNIIQGASIKKVKNNNTMYAVWNVMRTVAVKKYNFIREFEVLQYIEGNKVTKNYQVLTKWVQLGFVEIYLDKKRGSTLAPVEQMLQKEHKLSLLQDRISYY